MYQIIKNYCENENTNGLFLMDMPTGFGKTYSVLEYLFDSCQQEQNKNRLYFFITPLKKNLPREELREHFRKAGKIKDFDNKVLFIDANSESALQNFDGVKKEIPSEIKETEVFKRFEQEIEFLNKHEKSNDSAIYPLLRDLKKKFREHTEPSFRCMLQEKLKKYRTPETRLDAVKHDKKWKWLGKLYPAVFTQERQIFFMSIDKFLRKNSPIVEPSYYFYNSKLIDNAIIFIDEFDSTKEKILDYIIQNGLQGKNDSIRLFKSIYSALSANDFPKILTDFPKGRELLENICKKAEKLCQTYQLGFQYHTSQDMTDDYKNFLFQDYSFHSILNGDNCYITSETDQSAKLNIIRFTPEKPESEKYNIHSMLGELRGFIRFFQGMVSIFASYYRKKRTELTQEDTIRSILDLFQLSTNDVDYLTNQIIISQQYQHIPDLDSSFDHSIYENGFRYYCFENAASHDMRTRIMMCSFQDSPEKLLLQVCSRAKVIGISATATLPTVIGNFDLKYLQSKLHGAYTTLSQEDYKRLSQKFHDSQTEYQSKIQIHAELIGAKDYSLQTWQNILGDDELAREVYQNLEMKVYRDKSGSHYCHERYARIAIAFKEFLMHDDIQAMLCLLTKHPKEDSSLNFKTLTEILNYVLISNDYKESAKDYIECLTSENYEKTKKSITERLSKNEKLFVISTYQTIGAGQNLQYPVPKTLKEKLLCSNQYPARKEKDFDAIYLDKPTNLFAGMESDWREEDFVKYLFETEFLQENAELSRNDALEHIQSAFRCYMTGEITRKTAENVYQTKSIRMYATRTIIQAIGRICRTNQKRQNIYIFADSRISDVIDLSVTDGRILNYEFLALADKIRDLHSAPAIDINLEKKAESVSSRICHVIDTMLNREWTEKTIKEWQKLREFVLQHPTASREEAELNQIYRNYVELPEKNNILYYIQDEDFHEVKISFTQTQQIHHVLNAENTRLPRLMQWEQLYQHFISKGYATEFQPNDYILSPPLWNNIYKGALGEVTGVFWFQHLLNIQLEEITNPDEFELFDFIIPNNKIYVDFKDWSESTQKSWEDEIQKITAKAEKCNCHRVIIANILTKRDYKIQSFIRNDIHFLIIPALLNDKKTLTVNHGAVEAIRSFIDVNTD